MIDEFKEKLKAYLSENKSSFVTTNEWAGSTETGFHDEIEVDMDSLMNMIDEFSKEFTELKQPKVKS